MKRRTFIASAAALLFEPVAVAAPGPVVVFNCTLVQQQYEAGVVLRKLRDAARDLTSDCGPLFIGFDPGIASGDRTVVVEMVDGRFVHYADPGDDIERVLMEDGYFVHYREL